MTRSKNGFESPAAEAAAVLAEILLSRGDVKRAREFAERSVGLRRKAGDSAALLADSQRLLAQAMARNPAERAQALELARQARATIEPTRQDWRDIAQRLDRFIASAESP